MIIQKDNYLIEIERSKNGHPPGYKGMNVNHSSSWFRINNEQWIRNPFRSHIELVETIIKLQDDEVNTFIELALHENKQD